MRRVLRTIRSYVARAPGTYLWLAVLFLTSVVLHHMAPQFEEEFLRQRSTNIHQLSEDPLRVLVSSALWIAGGRWLPYAVLYSVFHAQAEHWLGTARWLAVCVAAHVLATYASQGVLLWAVHNGRAPQSAIDTLDIGVSYALAGVVAVLTYRLRRPWRYAYAAAVLVFYGVPVVTGLTFTNLGHFAAALIGFACWPLTRDHRRARRPKEAPAPVED